MTLILVAHGTRSAEGTAVTYDLADQVRDLLPEVPVRVAFADVRRPNLTDVLRTVHDPAVVVPLFLSAGYHVRVDVPAQIAASGRPASITPHLGPAHPLIAATHDHLTTAGWRPGIPVILAAAGSTDRRAQSETRKAALLLAARTGSPVTVAYAATAQPTIAEAVAAAPGPTAVATWLLAPGLFHKRITESGAEITTPPLAAHPKLLDLIARRYTEARVYERAA
ncbi:sirohydrochlorin chelatase [Actinokineospora fastidiosa]|uniref:Cobalamin biosynthesis protein CbiX n=1 Tax=Actinokineospora fastidiosa TaxID=1816 RepID=A0A918G1Z4_9PSEU|nr:sirohydrochlorin chelatase [Actinokineospora fastidiosa]GGS12794.1 cobalamin biosynthesis protein CbiX [Actinokineospora fastidiosa]